VDIDPVYHEKIKDLILNFFSEKLLPSIKDLLHSFVFDIYIDVPPAQKVWLIGVNPWLPEYTDALLLSWEELLNLDPKGWDSNNLTLKTI